MSAQPVLVERPVQAAPRTNLRIELAESTAQIREAQRLRYEVFSRELGARLHSAVAGIDDDAFDAHCHHLLVWDGDRIGGCTRILTADRARRAGGFYSQTEFNIDAVLALPGRFMEAGRTCVHRDYRNGAAITTMWAGLANFVAEHRIDYMIGCASMPLGDNGAEAWAIYADLARRYLSPPSLRVWPLIPLPPVERPARGYVLPPLLKAYLRIGAKICGEPYWDRDFNVADVFILVPTASLERRYARHFLGAIA